MRRPGIITRHCLRLCTVQVTALARRFAHQRTDSEETQAARDMAALNVDLARVVLDRLAYLSTHAQYGPPLSTKKAEARRS